MGTGDIKFTLYRYNPRRKARGVEAAQLKMTDGDDEELLWMSPTDIRKNIEIFGTQQGLMDAQEAYRKNVEINP